MTDHLPIESLRPGGAPAHPLPPEPVDPVWQWPESDDDRPDDPVVAKLGEGVWLHKYADIRTCGQCGLDFVSAAYLDAHRRKEHS
jgi:hypothetical protein